MSNVPAPVATQDPTARVRRLFESSAVSLQSIVPMQMRKYLTPDRLTRIVLVSMSRTPQLMQCSPNSILQACMESARHGLEPNGPLGHAYLIPFWNSKANCYEAQFLIGYKGYFELARRSGAVKKMKAECVYSNDKVVIKGGTTDILEVTPAEGMRGTVIGAYCVAWLTNGEIVWKYLSISEIDGIKNRSKAKDSGPWKTDFEAMCRKTVVRHLAQSGELSLTPDVAEAIEADGTVGGSVEQIPQSAAADDARLPESAVDAMVAMYEQADSAATGAK